ncbi:uncharacterized protein LOC121808970 [Salvia splendens]|uniref:uncharacterized protein LOC121808970 n=1 Tax=Salvia splendens TaxID=180675 RepID=UPI001C265159|nr:uncharacterized protein LOC121808970 [Salvia splendens]
MKGKLPKEGMVQVSAQCSHFLTGRIPLKMEDPGSCHISCEVENRQFLSCLLDQGSGISLMAQKTADEIGLLKRIKLANVHLKLADQSIIKLRGIVEDVLVKVDKFILLVDFMILDMEEDKNMPILFGRPFLAIGDVTLHARDNTVTFRSMERR